MVVIIPFIIWSIFTHDCGKIAIKAKNVAISEMGSASVKNGTTIPYFLTDGINENRNISLIDLGIKNIDYCKFDVNGWLFAASCYSRKAYDL